MPPILILFCIVTVQKTNQNIYQTWEKRKKIAGSNVLTLQFKHFTSVYHILEKLTPHFWLHASYTTRHTISKLEWLFPLKRKKIICFSIISWHIILYHDLMFYQLHLFLSQYLKPISHKNVFKNGVDIVYTSSLSFSSWFETFCLYHLFMPPI